MLTFMVNFVALSPHSQRSTYRDAHAVPSSSIVDLATGQSRESELVRSSSFAKKNNEEVRDWYHASKH